MAGRRQQDPSAPDEAHGSPEFVHLHSHSEMSLLDGLARIPDMVARAAAMGQKALAITDHGVLYGIIDFYSAALGVHFPKEKVFGQDDLRTRVEKLQPVLRSPDVQPEAVWAYGDLLNELRNSRPTPSQ